MGRLRTGWLAAVVVATVVFAVMCGGQTNQGTPTKACVPGASVACAAPEGCQGVQVCDAEGSALGPCTCTRAGADAGSSGSSSGGSSGSPDGSGDVTTTASSGGSTGGSSGSGTSGSSSGGSSTSSASGGGSTSGSGGSSSGGDASGSSGGGSTSSSGGGNDSGAGIAWGTTIPASDLGMPVTLTMNALSVAPGGEVYKCQVFNNPFGSLNTDIVMSHGVMSPGSHSFFLFNVTSTEAAVEPAVGTLGDCTGKGIEFHPFVFLSQQPDWTVTYPKASDTSPMGYPLVGANKVMIFVHYLNTSSTTLNVSAQVTLTPAKAGVVTTHVGSIFLNQNTMNVPTTATMGSPVHSTKVWAGDSTLAASYNLITSWSHMHRLGLGFSASTNGAAFYTETNWDSPGLFVHSANVSEPPTATGARSPVPMTNTSSITWDCTYYNDTGTTLTFGDSALVNVQCIYIGQYYPASASAPDIISVVN